MSERVVAGRWWRTAATCTLLTLVGTAAGPALGILFLILASPSIRYVNALSSLVYAFAIPLAVIGSTLLYRDLKQERPLPSPPAALPATEPGDAPSAASAVSS
jgi:hypothetical protein